SRVDGSVHSQSQPLGAAVEMGFFWSGCGSESIVHGRIARSQPAARAVSADVTGRPSGFVAVIPRAPPSRAGTFRSDRRGVLAGGLLRPPYMGAAATAAGRHARSPSASRGGRGACIFRPAGGG